jgi:predicted nucleotidyltransferase
MKKQTHHEGTTLDIAKVQDIVAIIKRICFEHGVVIKQMMLFGSRARGDFRADSDYDFIALTDEPLSHPKKMELWLYTSRALAEAFITADILFKSENEFQQDKYNKGKVTYYAAKEGVLV